jgi:hypothetical protein
MTKSQKIRRVLIVLITLVAVVSTSLLFSTRSKYNALTDRLSWEQTKRVFDICTFLPREGDDAYQIYLEAAAQYEQLDTFTSEDTGLQKCLDYFKDEAFFDDSLELRKEVSGRISALGNPIPTDQETQLTLMEIIQDVAEEYNQWQGK